MASEELESKKLELDQEIRRAEIELRKDELQVRKKEVEAQNRLLDAQVSQSKHFRWTNPATVALLGALIALIGNVAVTYRSTGSAERIASTNGQLQKDLADSTAQNNVALEKLKDEAASIVEVIKNSGGDPGKVKAGVCMLLKLNTIKSESTVRDALNYVNSLGGCETQTEKVPQEQWLSTSLTIPGCGNSGCIVPFSVCGLVPANMKVPAKRERSRTLSRRLGGLARTRKCSHEGRFRLCLPGLRAAFSQCCKKRFIRVRGRAKMSCLRG